MAKTEKIYASWPARLKWYPIRADGEHYYELDFGPFVVIAHRNQDKRTWRAYGWAGDGDSFREERDGYGSKKAAQDGALIILKRHLALGHEQLKRLTKK